MLGIFVIHTAKKSVYNLLPVRLIQQDLMSDEECWDLNTEYYQRPFIQLHGVGTTQM